MQSTTNVVFITGTSSGIGKATAEYFLARGWCVAATTRDGKAPGFTKKPNLRVFPVDVTKPLTIERALQETKKAFGGVDVIVNNAGYGLLGPLENTTEEQVRKQFDVNVLGVVNVTRLAVPYLRERGGGVIVNISSMFGRITLPYFSLYAGTKHAVEGISEGLFYELKPQNITVKIVEPGTVQTEFFKNIDVARKRGDTVYEPAFRDVLKNTADRGATGQSPELVARAVYRAATDGSSRVRYVPDRTAKMLLFLRATTPLRLFRWIIGKTVR
jgi:NAD(P)-dependent dehydrogenase (short-subunit alcohol dehydrogenase family)